MASDWMSKRACSKDARPLWDIDGTEAQHRTGKWICERRCPVRDACLESAYASAVKPKGMFGGLMFGDAKPLTVEQWHTTHGDTGKRKTDNQPGDTVTCEHEPCKNTFVITTQSKHKRFCSTGCVNAERRRQNALGLAVTAL